MPSFIDFVDLFIYGEWFINVPKKSSRYYNLIFSEPVCAIGYGVASLCCAMSAESKTWGFHNYSMTGVSLSICLSVDLSIFLSVCLPSSVDHLFLHSIHIGVHLSYLNKPVIKGHFYAGFTSNGQCF